MTIFLFFVTVLLFAVLYFWTADKFNSLSGDVSFLLRRQKMDGEYIEAMQKVVTLEKRHPPKSGPLTFPSGGISNGASLPPCPNVPEVIAPLNNLRKIIGVTADDLGNALSNAYPSKEASDAFKTAEQKSAELIISDFCIGGMVAGEEEKEKSCPFVTIKKPGADGGFFGQFPPDIIEALAEDGYFVDGEKPTPVGHINDELADRVQARHEEIIKGRNQEIFSAEEILKIFEVPPHLFAELRENGLSYGDGEKRIDKEREYLAARFVDSWRNSNWVKTNWVNRNFRWPGEYEKGKGGMVYNSDYIGPYKIPVPKETGQTIDEAKAFVGNYGRKTFVVKDGCLVKNLSRDLSTRNNIDASGYGPNTDGHFGETAY